MSRQKFVAGNDFQFSPRAFAQNWFQKLEVEPQEEKIYPLQTHEGRMIFRSGDDCVAEIEAVEKKYTIVTDITPSQSAANILKNLLFGQDGFLAAKLSYEYLSWFAAKKDKAVAEHLNLLSQNNAQIFDTLGNLVIAFGGDPNFVTANGRNFSTQFLFLNRGQFPGNAISMEQRAIKNLENAIEGVENASLKKLLSEIREDKVQIVQDLAKLG